MSITVKPFGLEQHGFPVTEYTLTNARGASVSILDFGGVITNILVPDRKGKLGDVNLGFDDAKAYTADSGSMGALIGRVGNRIKNARFTLNGVEYKLAANNGSSCLHGGVVGYDKKIWQAQVDGDAVFFSLTSPDGDEGFPGALSVVVMYSLSEDNALSIQYLINADSDTIQNMTNHAYFNLAGQNKGTILEQVLQIDADKFTRIDKEVVPTGEIAPVFGTPLDFTKPKAIGRDLDAKVENIDAAGGYDHNFVLNHPQGGVERVATAYDPAGGIAMDVYTDQPGVQLFTAPDFTYMTGKGGKPYGPRPAFCLETQHFADAMNNPQFPSIVLHAGEIFSSETVYLFRVEK